jgi:hypothetical protein
MIELNPEVHRGGRLQQLMELEYADYCSASKKYIVRHSEVTHFNTILDVWGITKYLTKAYSTNSLEMDALLSRALSVRSLYVTSSSIPISNSSFFVVCARSGTILTRWLEALMC